MEYGHRQAYWLTKANGMLVKKDDAQEMITKNEILLRDGVGNIKQKSINTGTMSYNYDNLYQLTNYSGAAVKDITYGYDYRGNRVSLNVEGETETTYTTGSNNRTTSIVDLKTISYDSRGNMTVKGGNHFTYDFKNRLETQYLPANVSVQYLYNSSDRKIRKTKNNAPVYYFYNGDKLLCEKLSQGRLNKIYTNDNEGVLGMKRYAYDAVTGQYLDAQKIYYLFDDLGSVTALTNETGMPIKYYQYDPFGNITNTTDDPGNNFTFVGRYGGYKDWDTGLINFWHRWYDSELGKWTSKDPIGIQGGVNLYRYVENNTTNGIDMLGLASKKQIPGRYKIINNVVMNVPDGVDIDKNADEASGLNPIEIYNKVKNGGDWDYKQNGPYEDFGNFHYGYITAAIGIPGQVSQRLAGAASVIAGTSEGGTPLDLNPPYGDNARDSYMIKKGFEHYKEVHQ